MRSELKTIAVLTSGGDSPGMNACIRAVTRAARHHGLDVWGVEDGYMGMVEGRFRRLESDTVAGIINRGGTFLGTSRCEQFRTPQGRQVAKENLDTIGAQALIVIGGDGSFAGAKALYEEHGVQIVGVPGTIDNDLPGTELTIGFDTAVNSVVEAVDRIRDTATSHHRMFFVEVMGRDSGRIALDAGICCGAEAILLPEKRHEFETFLMGLDSEHVPNRPYLIIVAEGDEEGGAQKVADMAKQRLPQYDIRVTVLGHLQRGGNPTARDRKLASLMGVAAIDTLILGESAQDPLMITWRSGNLVVAPLIEAFGERQEWASEEFRIARILSNP